MVRNGHAFFISSAFPYFPVRLFSLLIPKIFPLTAKKSLRECLLMSLLKLYRRFTMKRILALTAVILLLLLIAASAWAKVPRSVLLTTPEIGGFPVNKLLLTITPTDLNIYAVNGMAWIFDGATLYQIPISGTGWIGQTKTQFNYEITGNWAVSRRQVIAGYFEVSGLADRNILYDDIAPSGAISVEVHTSAVGKQYPKAVDLEP
jgi:hypothetical protein